MFNKLIKKPKSFSFFLGIVFAFVFFFIWILIVLVYRDLAVDMNYPDCQLIVPFTKPFWEDGEIDNCVYSPQFNLFSRFSPYLFLFLSVMVGTSILHFKRFKDIRNNIQLSFILLGYFIIGILVYSISLVFKLLI